MGTYNKDVERFSCAGIQMLGNFANGCLVGLTEKGAELWTDYTNGAICQADFSLADPPLFSALKTHGFFESNPVQPGFASAYIHVTRCCNLVCKGCYSKCDTTYADPTTESIERMLAFLKEHRINRVHISGGEPFLRSDLGRIIQYAKSIELEYIDIATNGTICPSETLRTIAPLVDAVHVSLGSYKPEDEGSIKGEGLFQRVIENVKAMLDLDIDVLLLPTIHSRNVDDIPHFMELAQRLGTKINFSILSCSACNDNLEGYEFDDASLRSLCRVIVQTLCDSKRMPALIAKTGCYAGTRQLSIDANGDIFPCHMLHAPAFQMGNALSGGLLDSNRYSPELQKLVRYNVSEHPSCKLCDFHYLCGGGCRARAFCSSKSIDGVDPYCVLLKSFFQHVFSYLPRQSN